MSDSPLVNQLDTFRVARETALEMALYFDEKLDTLLQENIEDFHNPDLTLELYSWERAIESLFGRRDGRLRAQGMID